MNRSVGRQQGFTLVELMLSMAFISVMLIAIALCIMQMSTIYMRGETLRQVNQASRVVATDLRRTFGEAHPASITIRADLGRLCTGAYTYVWTTPTGANGNNRYSGEGASAAPIRLVRVVDAGARYCANNILIDKTAAQPVELLQEGDRSLRIHEMRITPSNTDTPLSGQGLYTIRMLLGTDNAGAITTTDVGTVCRAPSDVASDFNYCALNEITLTVRAGVR